MNILSRFFVVVFCAASVVSTPVYAARQDIRGAHVSDEVFNKLIDEAMPAIYEIKLTGRVFETATGKTTSEGFRSLGIGTGFGVTQGGLMLTKMHVVNPYFSVLPSSIVGPNTFAYGNGFSIEVVIDILAKDGKTYKAVIVGGSPHDASDLALLQIIAPTKVVFPILELTNSLVRHDAVVTIGNPFGVTFSVGDGIVSNPDSIVPGQHLGVATVRHLIQTTALVLPGSSGGPIIRLRDGKVVGMVDSAYASAPNSYTSLGFGTQGSVLVKFLKDELLRLSSESK